MNANQRREAAARKLLRVGESGYALDLLLSSEPISFETLEHSMRERLKSIGPDMPEAWAKAVAGAIVECQTLPHIFAREQAAANIGDL